MPVNTPHDLYMEKEAQWTRCRDAYNGTAAVKHRGTAYLPMLGGSNKDEYEAYQKRALWYGATGRTVNGLVGAVTRKDAVIKVPDAMTSHLDDITLSGVPLQI